MSRPGRWHCALGSTLSARACRQTLTGPRPPAGREIDLGGIDEEYAVDCVYELLAAQFPGPLLVNFGGDLQGADAEAFLAAEGLKYRCLR